MGPVRARVALLLVLASLVALAAPSSASAQAGSESACPATFEVLHNDRIGRLQLPAGPYTITILNRSLSCAAASDYFRQFLQDWNGVLPRPWRYSVAAVGAGSFIRGAAGTFGFRVSRVSAPSGGGSGGSHGSLACPAYFTVLHNDRIGPMRIPAGRYRITLLAIGRLSCARAASLLSRFLQDFNGVLPRPWILDPETGAFMRSNRNVGFWIEPWTPPVPPNPDGRHPARGSRCPATFRVLNNDRIGRLRLAAGRYYITRFGSLSCSGASALFRQFLNDVSGNLPRPWRLSVATATFTRGTGGNTGFRVKPAG